VSARALILVERESQAPILLGAGGRAIKKLSMAARAQIEEFLGRPVYLEITVQVGSVLKLAGCMQSWQFCAAAVATHCRVLCLPVCSLALSVQVLCCPCCLLLPRLAARNGKLEVSCSAGFAVVCRLLLPGGPSQTD
jgi:hypothetical protein